MAVRTKQKDDNPVGNFKRVGVCLSGVDKTSEENLINDVCSSLSSVGSSQKNATLRPEFIILRKAGNLLVIADYKVDCLSLRKNYLPERLGPLAEKYSCALTAEPFAQKVWRDKLLDCLKNAWEIVKYPRVTSFKTLFQDYEASNVSLEDLMVEAYVRLGGANEKRAPGRPHGTRETAQAPSEVEGTSAIKTQAHNEEGAVPAVQKKKRGRPRLKTATADVPVTKETPKVSDEEGTALAVQKKKRGRPRMKTATTDVPVTTEKEAEQGYKTSGPNVPANEPEDILAQFWREAAAAEQKEADTK
jgi:hypothetical protein